MVLGGCRSFHVLVTTWVCLTLAFFFFWSLHSYYLGAWIQTLCISCISLSRSLQNIISPLARVASRKKCFPMDVLAPESVGCRNAISKELNTLAYYDPSKDYSYPPSECLNKGYRSYSTSREEAYCICQQSRNSWCEVCKRFYQLNECRYRCRCRVTIC